MGKSSLKNHKRGQGASGASALIAIIAGFILLYMLMIPADLREELLNDDYDDGTGTNTNGNVVNYNEVAMSEAPGRIDYMKQKEYEHNIPAINLFSVVNAKEVLVAQNSYVKNSIFDKVDKKLNFKIEDPDNIDNIFINFKLNPNRNNKGKLTIVVNGYEVYNRKPSGLNSEPLRIDSENLQQNNEIVISVSEVGWQFWTTNEYEIDSIKMYFDERDVSKQGSRSSFIVSDTEKYNLDRASLEFYPDCYTDSVGVLKVSINNFGVFSAIPDCGQMNKVDVLPSYLSSGSNVIEFETGEGKYFINNIVIETKMKAMTYPVYYFDLDEKLFSITDSNEDDDEECGDIDGYCPSNCDLDKDMDCCLEESSNYWCDLKPVNEDDRCRSVIDESTCDICKSGYEDESGEPPEVCEDKCGDDTDNECPSGCSKFYDEDCCFDEAETNYWCDEVPQWGASYTCRNSISKDDCSDCVTGYRTEEGSFSCPTVVREMDDTSDLKSYYNVWLTLKFADDEERKAAKFFVNGYQFYMDTTKEEYRRKINGYVEDGSNAIKIEPDTVLDIRSIDVEVKNR